MHLAVAIQMHKVLRFAQDDRVHSSRLGVRRVALLRQDAQVTNRPF